MAANRSGLPSRKLSVSIVDFRASHSLSPLDEWVGNLPVLSQFAVCTIATDFALFQNILRNVLRMRPS